MATFRDGRLAGTITRLCATLWANVTVQSIQNRIQEMPDL